MGLRAGIVCYEKVDGNRENFMFCLILQSQCLKGIIIIYNI